MKAIIIKQPWVHAILREGKDIENRSWQRTFRGWLAIHASGQPDRYADFPRGHRVPDFDMLDYSAICGVARVVDIVAKSRSKWFWPADDGSINFGWVLANVKALKTPIPCSGAPRSMGRFFKGIPQVAEPLLIANRNRAIFADQNGPLLNQHFFDTNPLHIVLRGFVSKKC